MVIMHILGARPGKCSIELSKLFIVFHLKHTNCPEQRYYNYKIFLSLKATAIIHVFLIKMNEILIDGIIHKVPM